MDNMIQRIKKAERIVRELVLLVLEIGTLLTVLKAIIASLF